MDVYLIIIYDSSVHFLNISQKISVKNILYAIIRREVVQLMSCDNTVVLQAAGKRHESVIDVGNKIEDMEDKKRSAEPHVTLFGKYVYHESILSNEKVLDKRFESS